MSENRQIEVSGNDHGDAIVTGPDTEHEGWDFIVCVPAEQRPRVALALLGLAQSAEAIGKALAAVIAYVDKAEASDDYPGQMDSYDAYALVCDLARALGVDPHH